MDTLQVAGMISKELKRSGVVDKAPQLASNVAMSFSSAGLTLCDLKPLAELLGCDSDVDMNTILAVVRHDKTESIPKYKTMRQIARALNWERTEFDTLDELLEELRASEAEHSKFVDSAIEQNELLDAVREKLLALAELSAGRAQRPLINELLDMLEPRSTGKYSVELDSAKLEARREPSVFAEGGYVKELPEHEVAAIIHGPRTYNCRCVLRPVATTHTLLHAGELYRDVTILLHTEQLVAWRTADGQEYSAPAHQVLLDPDEDGLAAALLSRIAGVEIAPEHMAELRAQMGVTNG